MQSRRSCFGLAILLLTTRILCRTVNNRHEFDFLTARDVAKLCNVSEAWQPTPEAYVDAQTDDKLLSLANDLDSGERFDHRLGIRIGNTDFHCSVNTETTCIVPSCFGKMFGSVLILGG